MNDELLELKSALQGIDTRLAQTDALERRRTGTARIQWGLWPVWLGQGLQMLLGLLMIGLGMSVWSALREGGALFASALAVHAYGVLCLVLGGATLGLLARIDRSEPLLSTQLRLAKLRRFYVIGGMVVGLPWWLFWMPFAATLFYWLVRVDVYAHLGGATAALMVAVGIAGLASTWLFHRWSRRPGAPSWAKAMSDAIAGESLMRAQKRLDELKAFGDDAPGH